MATVTGLRSMELMYVPVMNGDFMSVEAYRTELRINDPQMGVLLPDQYGPVAARSVQCEKLAWWAIETALQDSLTLKKREAIAEWLSVAVPVRLFMREDFVDSLTALVAETQADSSVLCLEMTCELLYEDATEVNKVLTRLRGMGVKTMLTDFGGDFCPVMRLKDMRFDRVQFAADLTKALLDDDRAELTASAFEIAGAVKAELIGAGVTDQREVQMLQLQECHLFTGKLAGKTKKLSSIRA